MLNDWSSVAACHTEQDAADLLGCWSSLALRRGSSVVLNELDLHFALLR